MFEICFLLCIFCFFFKKKAPTKNFNSKNEGSHLLKSMKVIINPQTEEREQTQVGPQIFLFEDAVAVDKKKIQWHLAFFSWPATASVNFFLNIWIELSCGAKNLLLSGMSIEIRFIVLERLLSTTSTLYYRFWLYKEGLFDDDNAFKPITLSNTWIRCSKAPKSIFYSSDFVSISALSISIHLSNPTRNKLDNNKSIYIS